MDTQLHRRYRDETQKLVARRGPLCVLLFAGGIALAVVLESYYHPERLVTLLVFFGLELSVCFAAVALYRRHARIAYGVGLMRTACIALLLLLTACGISTGANSAAYAFLFIVFGLTTALMFPWGARNQAPMAGATVVLYAVFVALREPGADDTLPVAYGLYAVSVGGALSVLGARLLNRQRFALFRQHVQLDRHLATFRDLTRTFLGFEPQRVLERTCSATLEVFGLQRLWAVWRVPGSSAVTGCTAHRRRGRIEIGGLAEPATLWTELASWQVPAEAFCAAEDDPRVPRSLRAAGVTTALCIPIVFEGELLGAICADDGGEPFRVAERELGLASVLASGAAIATANARLYRQVTSASEEKSTFLARIAHELRNPLQAQLWDLDGLQERDPADRETIERLRQNALLTLDVARELQQFAELETKRLAINPEPINVAQTFDNLQATAMALLEGRPVAFRTHIEPGAEVLVTDPFRLRQVLGNLISNAAKFTPEGAIELHARRAGPEIVLSVRDSGVGIEPEERESIFTAFYRGAARTRVPARGMGLGLAIAHEIATRLGGRIEVESEVGAGSTFRLVLPVGEPAATTPTVALTATILLIDDDERWRSEVAQILRHAGATVVEASDGFVGLRRARAERPDVIILDLGLPRLGGLDVLTQIKHDTELATVPVAVATADYDAQLEVRCREAGCDAYVLKPLRPADLVTLIAGLTTRHGRARDGTTSGG